MAFSTETFTGVMGQQTYTFLSLRFLSAEHLSLTVAGLATAFTINSARTQVTITGASIAGGESIVVTRSTPATDAGRLVDFTDLSHVRQRDLDTSALQLLYIAQESLEFISSATCMGLNAGLQWEGQSKRVENLAPGVAATDAATKAQLDAISVAAGGLPVVSAADNDKSLWVVAGAWAIRTPAQARVHLGLGTAALLAAGTGANQVVQLDGSARYPANDGRNIDLTNNAVTTALNLRYRSTVGRALRTAEFTPFQDAAATWSQSANSRVDPGTLTALDNSSDIVVDSGNKKFTLSAGTWEVEYLIRVYNSNGTLNNLQRFASNITNDDDTAGQTVIENQFTAVDIRSAGAGTRLIHPLSNVLLFKQSASTTYVFRCVANNAAGSNDLRIAGITLAFRKVSSSFT